MATITGLKMQKGDRERVSVFLDEEYAFSVSLMAAAGLKKGQTLSGAEAAMLEQEGQTHLAYQRAVRYLALRPRSRAEIEGYLRGKGDSEETVAQALARLEGGGYIDDQQFARFWVENRLRFRPRGSRAMRYELRQKGLAPDDIDAALEGLEEGEAAWDAVAGKLERWQGLDEREFLQKVTAFLSRRGFGFDVCRDVGRRAWEQVQAQASGDEG